MFGHGIASSSCEHGNKTSVYIKSGEFIRQLSDSQFLKEESFPWSKIKWRMMRWPGM
jgi:hypothetical protein